MKANIAVITIGIMFVIITGLVCYGSSLERQNQFLANKLASAELLLQRIPTIEYIQGIIGAEPDGILGPKTAEKWNAALCNQAYFDALKKMGIRK